MPEVVFTDGNGMKYTDDAKLLPLLVSAIQKQKAELDELEAALSELAAP